ncbi:MAG: amidohydrolase family protein, partial [Planifilum fimeticola]
DIFQNASGAPGVENLLPLMFSEGVMKGKITLLDLVRLLSERPAATFGLDYCKGAIAAGMDADLVVLDPRESYVLDERSLHSSAGWSPYHDRSVQGKIVYTFVRGKMVYDGQVIGQPGDGRFVRAKHH